MAKHIAAQEIDEAMDILGDDFGQLPPGDQRARVAQLLTRVTAPMYVDEAHARALWDKHFADLWARHITNIPERDDLLRAAINDDRAAVSDLQRGIWND